MAPLRARALRLLATREHSLQELRRKLLDKDADAEDVDAVLARLQETGLQSDARFAESFVRNRASRMGVARIRRELGERGVAGEEAAEALGDALKEDELARARAVWGRKFGEPPRDRQDWARQARFLQSRGFATEVIRKLLKEPFDESAQGQ
ncbi:MAG: recombination regulator RecX [Candidatus Dactylopiibacterium carminicum]|uniref:Regulatory protein RecX n=1 Tax=Candidatus Dactylopiibacterium carminicum TaxID=857335 RepID=A0A272EZA2_9RHOO|nr:recombination regulator RecX [Candidatus Dactylopiibacterium carminicum]PAS95415.1 MAG: recombination regulator RecX [Candidatus Dactylopiibacterium carminicum]PAS98727.1 MAG: recombination regulator RecX [Candidatus Dactylopiibacterium carminicum]PAT00898.1 MAG: recombination regulator RecX [Candidatus Dactylopiibacterium carminicum]